MGSSTQELQVSQPWSLKVAGGDPERLYFMQESLLLDFHDILSKAGLLQPEHGEIFGQKKPVSLHSPS